MNFQLLLLFNMKIQPKSEQKKETFALKLPSSALLLNSPQMCKMANPIPRTRTKEPAIFNFQFAWGPFFYIRFAATALLLFWQTTQHHFIAHSLQESLLFTNNSPRTQWIPVHKGRHWQWHEMSNNCTGRFAFNRSWPESLNKNSAQMSIPRLSCSYHES